MQPTTTTPLSMLINSANDLVGALSEAVAALEMALEAENTARRVAKEAAQLYQDAEAEYLYDLAIDGKNAEARKLAQDAALVKARNSGHLHYAWGRQTNTKYAAEDAAMVLEQASKRFIATKAACDLTAAILTAAVK